MRLQLTLTGKDPLLMHNQQLADPLNEHTRALAKLTGKRKKTEDDHRLIADTEYAGALYINHQGPFVPSTWIIGCLIEGGKVSRNGTDVKRAVVALEREIPLHYSGPRRLTELVADQNFRLVASVKVGTKRLMRTRPMFTDWSLTTTVELDTELFDLDTFRVVAGRAGRVIGVGDWRPTYGRFGIDIIEIDEEE